MVTSSMEPCSRPPSHCGTLLLSLLILAHFPYSTTSNSLAKGYVDHCESVVPHSTHTVGTIDYHSYTYILLQNGFFSSGDKLLAPAGDDTSNSVPSLPGHFEFYSRNLQPTRTPGTFKLDGSLYLSRPSRVQYSGRGRRNWHDSTVEVYGSGSTANFKMTGFWSKPSGKICMVGAGHASSNQGTPLNPTAVFKLNYPEASDISTSLVNGSIESLGAADSPAHFRPVSLLAYAQNNYSYTQIPRARSSCSRHVDDVVVPKEEVLGLFEDASSSTSTTWFYVQSMFRGGSFELERGINASCSVLDCRLLGFEPRFMSWSLVGCSEDGKVHMYVTFSRDGAGFGHSGAMHPERSFVAEGVWDREKNRLCALAFPVMIPNNSAAADAFVGGSGSAAVGISLWLPRVLSIEMRSTMVGRIWSEKAAAAPGGSSRAMISFRNVAAPGVDHLPGVRYEYTRTRDANTKSCRSSSRGINLENGMYPDGSSIGDLRFDLSLTDKEGHGTWGWAVPLSLGETFYGYSAGSFNPVVLDIETATLEAGAKPVLWNVSYKLSYSSFNSSSSSSSPRMYVDISAEGVYNAETGTICMVGCRDRDQMDSDRLHENIRNGYPMDCEISVSIQLAPMNSSSFDTTGIHLNGTIRSTRKKGADPLYFEPIEMSSYNMYAAEAVRTMRRMGAEVVMVLVSKTLSCVFVVLQLLHAKKRPQALPSVSVGTLVVLALGHAAHLVLNFEAQFFGATNKQVDVLLRSGGWLEANEVVVRLTTLLAFLLQLRLLQSAWSARSSSDDDDDEKKKKKSSLWVAERRALGSYCLPLYVAGALIALLFHQTQSKKLQAGIVGDATGRRPRGRRPHGYSVWEALISYAGLLTDGFLLPQIVLNAIGNCTEKALSPPYYVGMTLVRSFPHVYDAYRRSHYYVPSVDTSIIFATPHEDYYSRAWDVAIPFGGVLFAVLVFFQQKLGGSFFLPKRFRSVGDGYELVSVSTT